MYSKNNNSEESHIDNNRETNHTSKNIIVSLVIICAVSLFLRLYYFPWNIPLNLDALNYFFYASDINVLGRLPSDNFLVNNGWPIFLSIFFTIFKFNSALDYMTLQRIITILLSSLTIILVYFLCNKFVERRYAVIGAAIFAFEPRIIQNSLLGITEPLYIFLVTTALVLFFHSNRKLVYFSFAIIGFSAIVRSEGLFVFFPLVIMFFVRYRKERKIIIKIAIVISIFVVILLPISIYRIQTIGEDAITSRVIGDSSQFVSSSPHTHDLVTRITSATENFIKLSGWSMIPIFIFFIPIGIWKIIRRRNQDDITIIILIISMLLPVFYAFSLAPDTRYIYPLYPVFCILSVFTIKNLSDHKKHSNLLSIWIIFGILVTSFIFLDIKKIDYEHQREAFEIDKYITGLAGNVNSYYPEDSYIIPAQIPEKWPVLHSTISFKTIVIPTSGFNSTEDYIRFAHEKGPGYIVADNSKDRPQFLNEIFTNNNKPYLQKIFDSIEYGYKYHVKIFKINYSKLNSTTNIVKK